MSKDNKPVQGDLFIQGHLTGAEPARPVEKSSAPAFGGTVKPYIHSGSSAKTLALEWLAAIIPAFALYLYNDTSQLTTAVCTVAGSVLAKILWRKAGLVENGRSLIYAVYNGLLAAILLPHGTAWWLAISGMFIAVSLTSLSLYKFRVRLLNPALLAAAVASLMYPFSFRSAPGIEMPLLVVLAGGALFLALTRAITLLPSLIVIIVMAAGRLLAVSVAIPIATANVAAVLFLIPDYDNSPMVLRAKVLQALIVSMLALSLTAWTNLAAPLLIAILAGALITPFLE